LQAARRVVLLQRGLLIAILLAIVDQPPSRAIPRQPSARRRCLWLQRLGLGLLAVVGQLAG